MSIEKSERLSGMLDRRGIKHEVLNAKHHQREAEIVAQAGRKNAVTIATNMAGRGTDIILGGNPETMAWALLQDKYATRLDVPQDEWDELVERNRRARENEGRRARKSRSWAACTSSAPSGTKPAASTCSCAAVADGKAIPARSRFFLSLEDDLMRIFAGEWVKNMLTRLGMQEGEAIESRMVSRRIEGAQKKVEERNFDIRKNLLEYDEVMDEQRKRVYGFRQQILDGGNCKTMILEMIDQQIDAVPRRVPRPRTTAPRRSPSGPAASWASSSMPAIFAGSISTPPQRRPRTRPSGWPKARCSTQSRRTCPRTPKTTNGTGRRWPSWPTRAGSSTSATAT